MKRKILAISIVLIGVMAIAAVSALDLADTFDENTTKNQTITIEGIEFNVPEGFIEDPNHEIVNETKETFGVKYTNNGKLFEKNDTYVSLLVADYGKFNMTDMIASIIGGNPKTINSTSGYMSDDGDYKVFHFVKNNKLVVISAADENVIGDFVK